MLFCSFLILHFMILSLLFSSAASSTDRNRSRSKAHLLPSPREKVCVRSFSYSISSVHCVLLPVFGVWDTECTV